MKTTTTRRLAATISAVASLIGSVLLADAQEPDVESYFPVEHTITDASGRSIAAAILSKTDTAIKIRRTSDGKEFEMPIGKLSMSDQEFFKSLGKPGPIEKSELDISVIGSPVKVTRLGSGPVGIVFYGHTGSGSMMKSITSNPEAFSGLLPAKTSFFLWEYPESGPFAEVNSAIGAYMDGDKEKLRPNFKGIASEVLAQIRAKTGLKEFLVVGNSLGAGIVLWDYKELSVDPMVSFLLISPTEPFMPPVSKLGMLKRTMLLSASGNQDFVERQAPDPFLIGTEAREWVKSNLDTSAVNQIKTGVMNQVFHQSNTNPIEFPKSDPADFTSGHKTIGNNIKNDLLSKIIKVKFGMKPSSILAIRPNPYSLEAPYDVSWFRQLNEQPSTTPLKAKIPNVVKITLPTGETAVIEMTNIDGYTKPGSNTMTYRWKFRGTPTQPILSGEGKVIEDIDISMDKTKTITTYKPRPGSDSTIRAGGITVQWTYENVLHHYPSRATLTVLPAGAFDRDF